MGHATQGPAWRIEATSPRHHHLLRPPSSPLHPPTATGRKARRTPPSPQRRRRRAIIHLPLPPHQQALPPRHPTLPLRIHARRTHRPRLRIGYHRPLEHVPHPPPPPRLSRAHIARRPLVRVVHLHLWSPPPSFPFDSALVPLHLAGAAYDRRGAELRGARGAGEGEVGFEWEGCVASRGGGSDAGVV